MGKLTQREYAEMYAAREKVNNDRQTGLVDIPSLRRDITDMYKDPQRSNTQVMMTKYPYINKSSPALFRHINAPEPIPMPNVMKLLDDMERVERKELSNEAVGENIVRSFMPAM